MTSIVIRDVPTEVHEALLRRASAEGRSLQQYTLRMISEIALRRTQAEVLADIRQRVKGMPPIDYDQLVADINADRR
ncbi:MAG: hypothetical protein FWF36_06800 [Propionibacteriaceae bacterium]|nr:hypothetical protein [Propionibacteriaceae bacterium]